MTGVYSFKVSKKTLALTLRVSMASAPGSLIIEGTLALTSQEGRRFSVFKTGILYFWTLHTFLKKIFKNNIFLFIYLFLAALGLCCCARAFSSCGELGLLYVVVCGLLTAVASLVAEHGL